MSDLIFVDSRTFESLKTKGVYLVDSWGAESILIGDQIIKIFDVPEPPEPEPEPEPPVE